MTEQRLTTLLQELAADARTTDRHDLASEAWRVAGQRRRSRRMVGSAVAAVACLVVVLAAVTSHLTAHRQPLPPTNTSPTPSVLQPGKAQVAPERAAEPTLPYIDSPLPRSIDTSAAAVAALPPLASSPVQRAVALAESTGESQTPGPIVVIGSDGQARRLDGLSLGWVVDSGGNRQVPLDNGSLSPDGTHAAFVQAGRVVLVDLRTSTSESVALGGYPESVVWAAASDEVLVTGADRSALVNMATRKVTNVPGTDATAARFVLGGTPVSLPAAHVAHIDAWWGQAFASGRAVAVGAFGSDVPVSGPVTDPPQVVAVVDVDHPSVAHLLAFDWTGRYKGCCNALGWLDESTVIFSSAGGADPVRILAWSPITGAVHRISELTNASVVSVALR